MKKKDSEQAQLTIKCDKKLKADFQKKCESMDLTVSQVLRGYIRKFVDSESDKT